MVPLGRLSIAILIIICILFGRLESQLLLQNKCWGIHRVDCSSYDQTRHYQNLPFIKSVYCYNNGTGLCKGIAGRFEFYFNTFTNEILGPVEPSQYVDEYGYHERVPIAYNTKGIIVFNDRVINWARNYVDSKSPQFNLLYLKGINWCLFVEKDNWPYRSAIKDPYSNGSYHIYFFNKQSCITKDGVVDNQYNTRFTHESRLRIDQDMNPLIFVMEDNKAEASTRFRLVKNKRQHWSELTYRMVSPPELQTQDGKQRHFMLIDINEKQPQTIAGRGPLLNKHAYAKWLPRNWCLSDYYTIRPSGNTPNSKLVEWNCATEETEMADYNVPESRRSRRNYIYEAGLHCMTRYPKVATNFLGIDVQHQEDWESFAKDGLAFTAFTTIPKDSQTVTVFMMYAKYTRKPQGFYDEHYPVPFLDKYEATRGLLGRWNFRRPGNTKLDLNFVDDIAYLHYCKTILVILGPLYSEMPAHNFVNNQDMSFKIGSIDKLGLFEVTNAFFADPNKPHLYFYHRTNFVARHVYTCGTNDGVGTLVTAVKMGNYKYRHGSDMFNIFPNSKPLLYTSYNKIRPSEELFFLKNGVFQGNADYPDAPDPSLYPYDDVEPVPAPRSRSYTWIILLISIAVLIILGLCLICLIKFRKRLFGRTKHLTALPTQRSGALSTGSSAGQRPTGRSGLDSHAPGSSNLPTGRSGLSSRRNSTSATTTERSHLTIKPARSVRTVGDRISAAFGMGSQTSPGPRSASRSASRSHSRSHSSRSPSRSRSRSRSTSAGQSRSVAASKVPSSSSAAAAKASAKAASKKA